MNGETLPKVLRERFAEMPFDLIDADSGDAPDAARLFSERGWSHVRDDDDILAYLERYECARRADDALRTAAHADAASTATGANDDVESPLLDLSAPPAASYGSGFEGAAFTPKSVKWSAVGVDAPRTA